VCTLNKYHHLYIVDLAEQKQNEPVLCLYPPDGFWYDGKILKRNRGTVLLHVIVNLQLQVQLDNVTSIYVLIFLTTNIVGSTTRCDSEWLLASILGLNCEVWANDLVVVAAKAPLPCRMGLLNGALLATVFLLTAGLADRLFGGVL